MSKWRLATGLALFSLAVIAWRLVHHSGEVATDLLFGWAVFLVRVIPQLQLRWDGMTVFGIGLLGLVLLSQYLFHWLAGEMPSGADRAPAPWRWRWTIGIVGFVILMFTAGISVTGAVHQTVWLLESDQPLFGQGLPATPHGSVRRLEGLEEGLAAYASTWHTLPTHWQASADRPKHSWVTQILLFLNYSTEDIEMDRAWDDPINARHFRAVLPEVCNPQFRTPPLHDPRGFGLNHYAGNTHIFDRSQPVSAERVSAGAANVLLIGEVNSQFVAWGRPNNSRDPRNGIGMSDGFGGAPGTRGATVVMLDGLVRFIGNDIDPKVVEAMSGAIEE